MKQCIPSRDSNLDSYPIGYILGSVQSKPLILIQNLSSSSSQIHPGFLVKRGQTKQQVPSCNCNLDVGPIDYILDSVHPRSQKLIL